MLSVYFNIIIYVKNDLRLMTHISFTFTNEHFSFFEQLCNFQLLFILTDPTVKKSKTVMFVQSGARFVAARGQRKIVNACGLTMKPLLRQRQMTSRNRSAVLAQLSNDSLRIHTRTVSMRHFMNVTPFVDAAPSNCLENVADNDTTTSQSSGSTSVLIRLHLDCGIIDADDDG
jgi:hypothetical protein